MGTKPRYMTKLAHEAAGRLLDRADDANFAALVRAEAAQLGYSPRHMRRLVSGLSADQGGEANAGRDDEGALDAITAVFLACGNIARAHRMLKTAGRAVPSIRTFRRQMTHDMGTAMLEYARGGSMALRNKQVYLQAQREDRMHTVELDHTELPIYVVPRGHTIAQKPWITVVMEKSTRYVLSWVVTFGRPTAEEVRAALIQSMLLRQAPDGETIVGGLPTRAVWDRGLEFLADMVTHSCMRLGVMPVPLPAYSPHLKGRLERFWGFLKRDLLTALPGYTEGPQDLRGRHAIATAALGQDEFLMKLADWMDWYLTEHVNSSTGLTALQAWQADTTPLDDVPAERLWCDFLLAKPTVVSKNGLRFDRIDFVAPELGSTVGRKVEIRHLPHDRSMIEVFLDGDHLCTAYPAETLSPDQAEAVIAHRVAQRNLARQRFSVANRVRRDSGDSVRLETDRDGRRHVIPPVETDLLSGGNDAYARLITKTDIQPSLF